MSHGIVKPFDQVLSISGPEWHGLATVVESIGDAEIAPLLFPIRTGNIVAEIGGRSVPMSKHKALIADFTGIRPDLEATGDELVPLHIPKNSYRPIENGELWNVAKAALAEVDATVSCVGTLEAARKFFISVTLPGGNEMTVNGEKFLANLNIITSHDGTLAAQAYDSTVRIVCMNTLRWSLQAAGEVGFRVFHTAGAEVAMQNMPELVAAVLAGRADFKNQMEFLASIAIDGYTEAHEIALGYFAQTQGKDEAAKRTLNAAEEIATLFSRGAGNKGRTAYDLLNGATEYWTLGDGTGKKATKGEKVYKANFGTAAEHKDAFCNFLLQADGISKLREAGKRLLALSKD